MKSIGELFGPVRSLSHIRPPEGSYADWHRFLDECREAGIAAVYEGEGRHNEPEFHGFATVLGVALLRRWRWLQESEARGIPYAEAESAFAAAIERDSAAIAESAHLQAGASARAAREREKKRYGV
jgi:hypothetical protein